MSWCLVPLLSISRKKIAYLSILPGILPTEALNFEDSQYRRKRSRTQGCSSSSRLSRTLRLSASAIEHSGHRAFPPPATVFPHAWQVRVALPGTEHLLQIALPFSSR